jgi:hypothetical protein
MKAKVFLTGLALLAMTAFVNAQEPVNTKGNGNGNGNGRGTGQGTAYVDANKNGVCDNYENRATTATGQRRGKGKGVCNGTGQGKGQGNGQGKGKNFVDANGNGVCDTYEARDKK